MNKVNELYDQKFSSMSDEQKRLFFEHLNSYSKWKTFAECLGKLLPIDWGRLADQMSNEISIEAVAYGLYCIDDLGSFPVLNKKISDEIDRLGGLKP